VQTCDGATVSAAVDLQPNQVWGFVTGSGLMPGATVTLCDNIAGCYSNGTVATDGSLSRGPLYCCDVARTFFYLTTTTATGRTISSNTISNP
jgi:hypothetical protein